METWQLALIAVGGVAAVILGVMWLRIHPFVALLTAAIGVGLASGMTPDTVLDSVQKGMGNTLGFVAIVVGLGSMFGMMLEESGGAERLAGKMVTFCGEARTGMALGLVGFLVCIPVFLDVALVMVLPLAVAAAKRTGRNVTVYALPMLSGMAVTHAFVPPTPGPTTVAQLLSADLGWVIALGIVTGLPTLGVTAWIAGTVHLAKRVSTGHEGYGLFVVHGHASKRLADVSRRSERVRVAVGALRVDVDQTHLNRSERILEVAVTSVALVTEHLGFGTPVNVFFRLPEVGASASKSKGFEAHSFKGNITHQNVEVPPR